MPVFLNWLLRLIPTNPICMRLIQGGSRRMRHLFIRAGYLALMIAVLLFALLGGGVGGSATSLRSLASAGAGMFEVVSYLQVGLICLLTPVFMAGAISQEANPQTWDIMLTTPLNNLQIVLGNLFGRLFFVLALLFSSLPLFAVTQYFGGVPGNSILASYLIAGCSALLVASIAVMLSVTRTAGRRAVFVFYISVVMYLFVTYMIDAQFLRPNNPVGPGSSAFLTTAITPLNPFLVLEVLLQSNSYVPHDLTGTGATWVERLWFSRPIAAFCWLCVLLSVAMAAFSTLRLRVIGAKIGQAPWYRRIFGLTAKGAAERPPRTIWHNPIAWRECAGRGNTTAALFGRWGFVAIGLVAALAMLGLHQTGSWNSTSLQAAMCPVIAAEIIIIALVALNMSATAVSREREDGTLDIILTTPIQPGPYLAGKLRGLIQFLVPMMLVPVGTMALLSLYVMLGGFGAKNGVMVSVLDPNGSGRLNLPLVFVEGALLLPVILAPFIAVCVMIGLHWSIKSKGSIGSVIAAVFFVIIVFGIVSLCGMVSGGNLNVVGAVINGFSPINVVISVIFPTAMISDALGASGGPPYSAARISLFVGTLIAAGIFAGAVAMMHGSMKRSFMMTVRRLAGTSA